MGDVSGQDPDKIIVIVKKSVIVTRHWVLEIILVVKNIVIVQWIVLVTKILTKKAVDRLLAVKNLFIVKRLIFVTKILTKKLMDRLLDPTIEQIVIKIRRIPSEVIYYLGDTFFFLSMILLEYVFVMAYFLNQIRILVMKPSFEQMMNVLSIFQILFQLIFKLLKKSYKFLTKNLAIILFLGTFIYLFMEIFQMVEKVLGRLREAKKRGRKRR